jgi:hypothetical protein
MKIIRTILLCLVCTFNYAQEADSTVDLRYRVARRAYERLKKDKEERLIMDSLLVEYIRQDSTKTLEIKSLRSAVESLQKADSLSQVQVGMQKKDIEKKDHEIKELKTSRWVERGITILLIIAAIVL